MADPHAPSSESVLPRPPHVEFVRGWAEAVIPRLGHWSALSVSLAQRLAHWRFVHLSAEEWQAHVQARRPEAWQAVALTEEALWGAHQLWLCLVDGWYHTVAWPDPGSAVEPLEIIPVTVSDGLASSSTVPGPLLAVRTEAVQPPGIWWQHQLLAFLDQHATLQCATPTINLDPWFNAWLLRWVGASGLAAMESQDPTEILGHLSQSEHGWAVSEVLPPEAQPAPEPGQVNDERTAAVRPSRPVSFLPGVKEEGGAEGAPRPMLPHALMHTMLAIVEAAKAHDQAHPPVPFSDAAKTLRKRLRTKDLEAMAANFRLLLRQEVAKNALHQLLKEGASARDASIGALIAAWKFSYAALEDIERLAEAAEAEAEVTSPREEAPAKAETASDEHAFGSKSVPPLSSAAEEEPPVEEALPRVIIAPPRAQQIEVAGKTVPTIPLKRMREHTPSGAVLPGPTAPAESPPAVSPTWPFLVEKGPAATSDEKESYERWMKAVQKPLPVQPWPGREVLDRLVEEFPWASELHKNLGRWWDLAEFSEQPFFHLPPLLLVGAPGTGKSRLAARLARWAGVPNIPIVCAGRVGSMLLAGVERGWRGARPNAIFEHIANKSCANPIVLLDELDKASPSTHNGDFFGALLPFLEPETARAVQDSFLYASFDYRPVTFIATANDASLIPGPLLSRFQVIHLGHARPEHLDRLMTQIREDMAEQLHVDPTQLPGWDDTDRAALLHALGPTFQARAVRKAVEERLAEKARRQREGRPTLTVVPPIEAPDP